MTSLELILFLLIAGLGSFVQALSGFALGLMVLGLATLFDLASIAFTAAVISLISLVNGTWVLRREANQIDRRTWFALALPLAPGVLLGLALLNYLDAEAPLLLRRILGGAILLSGLLLAMQPKPLKKPSGALLAALSGFSGGLLGGLFSTSGPPLVLYLYRQPFPIAVIRASLLAVFVFATVVRTALLIAQGQLGTQVIQVSLLCVPVVVLTAHYGARLAPRVPPQQMRRLAFLLLALLGAGLAGMPQP